ncbi:hypothetical protein LTT02_21275 [Mycolicibacterium smegmatis]|uniref:hypothetical protein n=1 Tax=Mycolicibacterium smegmatis TaxID=1772 RepID=UPI0005D7D699|nr:hypothetical protein [Mycolicibacterium smegmatis]MCP2621756.1 hypothetical protein [Mycolicibacterium smegmatis]MDF1901551.1 hypothetical protein [Mycolicibacterium smegmatis]MDF1907814.1 hypothetical protein [Mycolicibacterium smegmatis]MDF1918016.1 hypothetical protein [Mycolicibacterium smegmatis]MDF1926074.1 hypothetical protein [Mycolicibacterium smegmatis]
MYDHDPWGDDDAWGEPGPHTDELADLDYTGPLDEQNDADGTASQTDVDDAPEAESLLLVSASNSAATVTATALTGGQILRVELAPQVVKLTEHELAEEIIGVSAMARQQGAAARHAIIAEIMRLLGHDPAATHSFLERNLGLPTPDTVLRAKAEMFANRYAEDD